MDSLTNSDRQFVSVKVPPTIEERILALFRCFFAEFECQLELLIFG